MSALTGALGILLAYLAAGWIGYRLGVEATEEKTRNKRGYRREVTNGER